MTNERSCSDCKWHKLNYCHAPIPKAIHYPNGMLVMGSVTDCPVWEKREATAEEKQKRLIDAAINVAANFGSGGIDPNIRIPLEAFNELREATGMATIPAWEAPPRINKAELLVRAGWKKTGPFLDAWEKPHGAGIVNGTHAAYAEMIRQADCR